MKFQIASVKLHVAPLIAAAAMIWLALSVGAYGQDSEQSAGRGEAVAATAPVVPQQVRYTGKLASRAGETVEAEFRIYAAQEGGEALWTETQQVPVSVDGSYAVLLGSSSATGLPQTVFAGGAARWLGVSVGGGAEAERVLLSSVPYAMKSADAESLAGHAASDFVTQAQLAALAARTAQTAAAVEAAQGAAQPDASHPLTNGALTGSGTSGTIPVWNGQYTEGNSNMVQVGNDIGINVSTPASALDVGGGATVRGTLALPAVNTATTATGYSAEPLESSASAWSTTATAAVAENFALEATPVGNNTASPSGALALLYSSGTAALAPTGFSIGSNGLLTFAAGQTFPGVLTSATGVSPITATTSSGAVTVGLNTAALETTLNKVYPQLTVANTFTSSQTIDNGLTVTGPITGSSETLTGTLTSESGVVSNGAINIKTILAATPTTKYNSPLFQFGSSVYNSTLSAAQLQNFGLGVFGTGNNTATPSAYLAVLSGQGTGALSQTGLTIGANGVITFAPAQTFPIKGTGGGTITGITTASPLTGSGTSGSVALGLNTSALGTTLESTFDSRYALLSGGNVFTSYLTANQTAGPGNAALLGWGTNGSVGTFGSADTGYGVEGVSESGTGISGSANQGYGVSGTSYGDGNVGTSLVGVMGLTPTPAPGSAGVLGDAYASSGSYDTLYSFSWVAGVWGDTADVDDNTLNQTVGVIGTADLASAGFFVNNSVSEPTLEAANDSNGGSTGLFKVFKASTPRGICGFGDGDLSCTGQMKSLVSTGGGARRVETYAPQSAENWMEDYGTGVMQMGVAVVKIDPTFAETVSETADYHVFLTPRADSKGLYVINATPTSFEVRESGGGTSSLTFDYKIVAKRRGYEKQRLVDVTERFRAEEARMMAKLPQGSAIPGDRTLHHFAHGPQGGIVNGGGGKPGQNTSLLRQHSQAPGRGGNVLGGPEPRP